MPKRKRIEDRQLDPTYLREWREHKGINQQKAAAAIGIDQAALSRIESGKVPYSQLHLQELSKLYGVTITDLLIRDPRRPRPGDALAERVRRLESAVEINAIKTLLDALQANK